MLDEKARFLGVPTHSTEARLPGAGGMGTQGQDKKNLFEKTQAGALQEPTGTDVL